MSRNGAGVMCVVYAVAVCVGLVTSAYGMACIAASALIREVMA